MKCTGPQETTPVASSLVAGKCVLKILSVDIFCHNTFQNSCGNTGISLPKIHFKNPLHHAANDLKVEYMQKYSKGTCSKKCLVITGLISTILESTKNFI